MKTAGEQKRPGPPSLFRRKVLMRRPAVMTTAGHVAVDAMRERLTKALGLKKTLSFGDAVELLAHYGGARITADEATAIADLVNAESDKAAAG